MRKIILFLFLFLPLASFCAEVVGAPFSLREKYKQAQAGNFIVTEQDHTYSLLFIREVTEDHLLLEEIAVPDSQIALNKMSWLGWVKAKAPGHTSWTLYEIDAHTSELIEAFSYSKRGWLYLDETQQFLSKLLSLPLTQLGSAERKKIGPQPSTAEADRRAVWNPPLILEGKKQSKPQFDVWKGIWPEDGTPMSKCAVELYFSKLNETFPFPYWIEVKSPHYTFKMRTVDSGTGIISPYNGPIPHRPPQFTGHTKKTEKGYRITLESPLYYKTFHLYAIDLNDPVRKTISIPHQINRLPKSETVHLDISLEQVAERLTSQRHYQWVIIPEEDGRVYVESDEIFVN